jgi:hypothetical protein
METDRGIEQNKYKINWQLVLFLSSFGKLNIQFLCIRVFCVSNIFEFESPLDSDVGHYIMIKKLLDFVFMWWDLVEHRNFLS